MELRNAAELTLNGGVDEIALHAKENTEIFRHSMRCFGLDVAKPTMLLPGNELLLTNSNIFMKIF